VGSGKIANYDDKPMPVSANRRFEGLARFLSPQKSCQKVLADEFNKTVIKSTATIFLPINTKINISKMVSSHYHSHWRMGSGKAAGFGA
ncbi:MAG: hypothetical protein FWB86_13800, partial [Treponema sp.]|nr:hypothetical protein [Treponema sp.]